MERPKAFTLRFTVRGGGRGRPVEVMHMYDSTGSKVFLARCSRSTLMSFIERLSATGAFNARIERSRSGRTIALLGDGAEDLFRRVVIFAGVAQCTRSPSKVLDAAEVLAGLGEFEVVFWYTKILGEYERRGFWGVCRVARSFRTLYRID